MLRIERLSRKGDTHLTVSGQLNAENLAQLTGLVGSEAAGRRIVLDLKDLTVVDRDAVQFLAHCQADRISLKHCPPYVCEWIRRESKTR
jgi:anti-anti-sigma regulatory factor